MKVRKLKVANLEEAYLICEVLTRHNVLGDRPLQINEIADENAMLSGYAIVKHHIIYVIHI